MVGFDATGVFSVARLDKISVGGFRSIQLLDSFPLTNINLLIGANGSGKSNFLELFKCIRAYAKLPIPALSDVDLKKYVLDFGTASDFIYKGLPKATSIKIELHFGIHGYRFSLKPTQAGLLRIDDEYLQEADDETWQTLHSPDGYTPGLLGELSVSGSAASLMYESMKNWQMYHFHDTGRLVAMKLHQDANDAVYLRSDGSNIASFLLSLRDNPASVPAYREILNAVRLVAPFFDDFILEPTPAEKVRLMWKQKGTDTPMQPQALSDGTLRFICLAVALLQPKVSDTIIIDEPELGLHPFAITILSELIEARAHDTQVIMATQSPELVSCFDAEDIIVCDRHQGSSTFTRLDAKNISLWLEEYSLGELWQKGILNGEPAHE